MKLYDYIARIPNYTRVKLSGKVKDFITYAEVLRQEWHRFDFDNLFVDKVIDDDLDGLPTLTIFLR